MLAFIALHILNIAPSWPDAGLMAIIFVASDVLACLHVEDHTSCCFAHNLVHPPTLPASCASVASCSCQLVREWK
jgi:hypothetical protein